jgi:predicted NAD/FAD-binding protein
MSGRRVAVVGSGVAGLTAAYLLQRDNEVTLFEADGRLGGHADTHLAGSASASGSADDGTLAVDTGFIVHNERAYPLLTRLFSELGVATQYGEMSMSVRCRGCGLQYAGQRGPGGLIAGLRRGRGRYARMLTEVTWFHRGARRLLDDPGDQQTLGQFLGGGYSAYFTAHFAAPFVAAVWSCPARTALDYPARYLFTFHPARALVRAEPGPSGPAAKRQSPAKRQAATAGCAADDAAAGSRASSRTSRTSLTG